VFLFQKRNVINAYILHPVIGDNDLYIVVRFVAQNRATDGSSILS
jgi:hypothetical protein